MFSFTLRRPRVPEWRGWLPTLALPLAMFAALIALGGDRGYFYRDGGIHNHDTVKTLAIAGNFSPEHNFVLTHRVWRNEDGGLRYFPYSRFPVGGYALVKLAFAPFGDDLAAKLLAARVLMLLMFCGAATFAYISICRITGSRAVAFAAVALAFSGFYAVYYADSVSNEAVMELFGAALAFHGMVVFVQEGRFRQLAVKACAALLLGWRVYALLLPFIALGLGGEAFALLRAAVSSDERVKAARLALVSIVRSRYAALAAVAILFGSALLAFNLANEYAARVGEIPLSETPTFDSMMKRLGLRDSPDLEWGGFSKRQFYRVGVMSVPYSLVRAVGYDFPTWEPRDAPLAPAVLGAAAACAAALGALAFVRRCRILVATALLFGFCWAIPMRYNTVDLRHGYEALPFAGLTLTLFALALIGARRLMGERVVLAVGAAALAAFAASVFHAGQLERNAVDAEFDKTEMAEASAIREVARGKRVRIMPEANGWRMMRAIYIPNRFYMSGMYFKIRRECASENDSDFLIAPYRHESLDLLTPNNRIAFLYGAETAPLDICRAQRRRIESSEPAARSVFDVYFQDGSIAYLKDPCDTADIEAPFFGYVYPADPNDLPETSGLDGFLPTFAPIRLSYLGLVFDGACLMTMRLPDLPIAAVQTGQWTPGGERLWDVFAAPPLDDEARAFYESAYQAIASSGEPAVRAEFDLYLDGDTLSYLKEPCGEDDARGRFFLSVHPADVVDLPAERLDIGHDSLNFTFAPPAGFVFNGKCVATRRLPDYPISHIETGQFMPGEGELWSASVAVGD